MKSTVTHLTLQGAIDFGNYLLSDERVTNFKETYKARSKELKSAESLEEALSKVHDVDIENFLNPKG